MWDLNIDFIKGWMDEQDADTLAALSGSFDLLEQSGPLLRRPMVGTLRGTKFKNLKELRPTSSGRSEVRIIFAFDPARTAVLLLAGDKANAEGLRKALKWGAWYAKSIPIAEKRYSEHLKSL
jgi:hypothetical protein